MKAIGRHDDAIRAEAFLKVDDEVCTEFECDYELPDGACCAFVPTETGQLITVDAACYATTNEVYFDLLVDGILRNTVKVNSKEWKSERRNGKFSTVFLVQDDSVLDVNMHVEGIVSKGLEVTRHQGAETIGSIEIRIYVLQDIKQVRHIQSTRTFLDQDLAPCQLAYRTGLIPIIGFLPSGIQSTSQKLAMKKKQVTAARPGYEPWAVFRFYYRHQEDMDLLKPQKAKKNFRFLFDPPLVVMADNPEQSTYTEIKSGAANDIAGSERAGSELSRIECRSESSVTDGGRKTRGNGEATHLKILDPGNHPAASGTGSKERDIHKSMASALSQAPISSPPLNTPKSTQNNNKKPSPQVVIAMSTTALQTTNSVPTMARDTGARQRVLTSSNNVEGSPPKTPVPKVEKAASDPASDSTQRAEKIRAYHEENGGIAHVKSAAQDLLIHQHKNGNHMHTPTPEKKRSGTAMITTPPSLSKRRVSFIPDTASKKIKEENEGLEKLVAAKRALLASKRKGRFEAQKKAEDAETKRKAELQRMMEELEAEMETEHELTEQAEWDFQESESAALAASREHYMDEVAEE